MSHVVEKNSETEASVRIHLTREQIQSEVQTQLADLGHQVRIPGFRPGKVPRKILEKRYGASVAEDVRRKLIEDELREAIQAHDLHPLSAPSLEPDDVHTEDDGSVRVELQLEFVPHFELPAYRGLQIPAPEVQVAEEDVDREVETLRQQAARVEEVEGAPATSGDLVLVDLTYQFLDGGSLPPLEERIVDTGAGTVDGIPCEAAIGRFVGATPGAQVKVTLQLPDDFPDEEHRGRTAVAACTVKAIRRVTLPELDSPAFLEQLGVASPEDLRQKVHQGLERHLADRRQRMIEQLCVDAILERTEFALPPSLLTRRVEEERERMRREGLDRGVPAEEIERRLLEVDSRLREQTERRIRETILLDRIVEREAIEVQTEDLEMHFRAMAHALQMEAQQLFDHFVETEQMPGVVDGIRRQKARHLLRATAVTSDEDQQSGSPPDPTASEEAS